MDMTGYFSRFANSAARATGHPLAFASAVSVVVLWAVMGPRHHYSDTWQLVINTGTTIVTFMMVFLIQNTQNRDGRAMQIKLDELIRALPGAHNAIIDLEALTDQELDAIGRRYAELAAKAREAMKHGGKAIDTPNVEMQFPEKPPQ